LVIELTDAGYVALGDTEAVAANEARVSILIAAPSSEADALREADLLSEAGVKRTVGQEVIKEHLEAGRLHRIGAGKKGDAYRYWRSPAEDDVKKVAAAAPVVPAESNGHYADTNAIYSAALRNAVPAERIGADATSVSETVQSDRLLSAGTASSSPAESIHLADLGESGWMHLSEPGYLADAPELEEWLETKLNDEINADVVETQSLDADPWVAARQVRL
jgi:hypothetical protein